MKVTVIPIGDLGTVTKELLQGLEDLENKRRWGDHPNYIIFVIGQNTEKSPVRKQNSSEKTSPNVGVKIS